MTNINADMTYDEIIETLRTYATETLWNCPEDCPVKRRQEATCRAVFTAAADAIEDLQQLDDNIEKERRCLEEEVHRLNDGRHRDTIELACKNTEIEILRGELRRMFQLYVAAETRADAGVGPSDEL